MAKEMNNFDRETSSTQEILELRIIKVIGGLTHTWEETSAVSLNGSGASLIHQFR